MIKTIIKIVQNYGIIAVKKMELFQLTQKNKDIKHITDDATPCKVKQVGTHKYTKCIDWQISLHNKTHPTANN